MTDRQTTERVLRELHEARIAGQLERMCALFAPAARFRIAGTSDGKPIAMSATGQGEIRPWLAMLVKAFKLSRYEVLSEIIDDTNAAVHWRATIHSKVTGAVVATELIDLAEVQAGRIVRYTEFFVPS